ncbi:MAG TPA: HAD hydrolase-like protein [Alphaproteobacteria bacterium]|nr:HAD hydrolase-like protein [Alphaproteobacteria bacterium]
MPLDKSRIHGVVWDLDNTLYRFTDAFYKSCTEAAAQAALEMGIKLSYEDTLKLAERSEQEYGYSMHGYVTDHGLTYASLHFPFHQRIDETVIDPIEGVEKALRRIKMPQVILTNASRCWAQRVLKFTGLDQMFPDDKIVPMEDVNFEPKARSTKGFRKAAKILGIPPENLLMVDDLDRNLAMAYEVGLQTAYIHHGDPMQELPDFIDEQFKDVLYLEKFLNR